MELFKKAREYFLVRQPQGLPKKSHLRVKSNLRALTKVLGWFEQASVVALLGQEIRWQCSLALTEAFTNAVRHAHQGLPTSTPIDIELILFDNSLEMKVWDKGEPFDLETQLERQITLQSKVDPLNGEILEGGRGLIWINQLMDELEYLRIRGRNCLLMRKKLT